MQWRTLRILGVGAALAILALAAGNNGYVGLAQVQPLPDMVLIPAGSFQMGDSFDEGDSDELPVHTVTVSAFYMDQYEVTKGLWDEVAHWASAHGYDIGPANGMGKAVDYPVLSVNWYEVVKWCNARSEKGRVDASLLHLGGEERSDDLSHR